MRLIRALLCVFTIAVTVAALSSNVNADRSCLKSVQAVSSVFSNAVIGFVLGAGDINSDGYADILLAGGSTMSSGNEIALVSGKDKSVLYQANLSGLVNSPVSVDLLDDLTGDGIPEIVVSAPIISVDGVFGAGAATVYDITNGAEIYTVTGSIMYESFGFRVKTIGDVTGDGVSDFIVSATWFNHVLPHNGYVKAFSGADGAELYRVDGDQSINRLGGVLVAMGDVSGDAVPDFAASSFFDGESGGSFTSGRARVYSGVDGALLYEISDPVRTDSSKFGWGMEAIGDIDGDGSSELLIGSPYAYPTQTPGAAYIYSGVTGALFHTISAPDMGANFGSAVSGGTDVDGDGVPDYGIRSTINTTGVENGILSVYSGADLTLLSADTGDGFTLNIGWFIDFANDINGDCMADILATTNTREYLSYSLIDICATTNPCGACCNFPGDASDDQSFNIGDVTYMISYIFSGGTRPACSAEGDANADGSINIGDVTWMIPNIFAGGPPPVCGP